MAGESSLVKGLQVKQEFLLLLRQIAKGAQQPLLILMVD